MRRSAAQICWPAARSRHAGEWALAQRGQRPATRSCARWQATRSHRDQDTPWAITASLFTTGTNKAAGMDIVRSARTLSRWPLASHAACAGEVTASASRARRALAVLLLLLELVVLVVPAVVPCCPRCQRCAAEVLVALVVLLLLVYFCLRACPPAGRAAQGEPTRDGGHVREQNCALTCSTCLFA